MPVRPLALAALFAAVLSGVPPALRAEEALALRVTPDTVAAPLLASAETHRRVAADSVAAPLLASAAVHRRVAADSVAAAPMGSVEARTAFRAAWAQRQAGDFAGAIATADRALEAIQTELSTNPDASERLELVDLKSKLDGLRHAARKDAETASSAAAAGNDATERVLNAPAIEEIQPQMNPDVYRYIDFFTGAGRSQFERWLKRSGRYMELFREVLHKEGLPPDLVHLVFVESGFNLNARSVSAAVGPWQLLRGTARMWGLSVNQWVDERKDPEKSSVAAARYLKHLYSVFGDWPLALASYNAGEGTVLRAIQKQGTSNYWDLKLPRQTEDYVPQFMAVLAITHDPERYGFDTVPLDDPMEFDQIAFKGPVDLHAVAHMAGCTYEDLKLLNPAVLRAHVAGPQGVTTLRVPPGKGEVLMQKLGSGATLPAVNLTLQHRVKSGETLAGIAAQYSVSAHRLALTNGIGQRRPLRRGMLLTVPASLSSPSPPILDASDPRASTAYVPAREIKNLVSIDGHSTAEGRMKWTVRRGQTLATIADSNSVTVEDIMRWNHLTNTRLTPGQRLRLRSDSSDVTLSSEDSTKVANLRLPKKHHRGSHRRYHTSGNHGTIIVRPGETLGSIAKRHGTTVGELMRLNGLGSSTVHAGQPLRVRAS